VLGEDRDPAVRLAAVPWMERSGFDHPTTRADLARMAASDASKEVREAARSALGGGPR
jgi:hypothetical protein